MKEKLQALLKSEGLKSSQLAEILEINPAGISHILAGRNRPGFDLLQKILRRFPQINPDWLLLDSEQMYRNTAATFPAHTPPTTEPMLSGLFASDSTSNRQTPASTEKIGCTPTSTSAEPRETIVPGNGIERIVVLYADGTFKSFVPTKR